MGGGGVGDDRGEGLNSERFLEIEAGEWEVAARGPRGLGRKGFEAVLIVVVIVVE